MKTHKFCAVLFNQADKNYETAKNNPKLKNQFDKQVEDGTILSYEITDFGVIVEQEVKQ